MPEIARTKNLLVCAIAMLLLTSTNRIFAQSSSHSGTFYALPTNSNQDITGDITIEAWVRPNAAQTNIGNILMKGSYGYAIGIMNDGTIAFWNTGSQNSGPESTSSIVQDGTTWTHVAIAVDYNVCPPRV